VTDWESVRELAGALPGAEESTTYGQPAFKVDGKLFAWLSPDRHAEVRSRFGSNRKKSSFSSVPTPQRTSRPGTTRDTRFS
jgi:hypothetical protein